MFTKTIIYKDMSFQLPSVKDPMVTNNISYKVAKENHEKYCKNV